MVPSVATAGGPEDVGFVLEMRGQWMVEGKSPRAIAEGDRLAGGARVRPEEPDSKAKKKASTPALTVSFYDGTAQVYAKAVTLPLRPPKSRPKPIWEEISGQRMGGYVQMRARSFGDDTVAKLDGATLDLAPVFHGRPTTDDYRLQFDRLVPDRDGAPIVLQVAKGSTTCRTQGLRPGLYEVTVFAGENREAGRTWVLLTPPPGYDRASRTYAEAVTISNSKSWAPDVSPLAVKRFRRACLLYLAEHPER
jgi:hypothetical protein